MSDQEDDRDERITIRLPGWLLDKIDARVRERSGGETTATRASVVRGLVEAGLEEKARKR